MTLQMDFWTLSSDVTMMLCGENIIKLNKIYLDALQPLRWIDFGGISHFDRHVIYQNITRLIECIVVPFHLIYFVFM